MTLEEAKRKLYDTTFLLGRFRRRAAIRELAEMPDPAGVLLLAKALGQPHPNSDEILGVFQRLSPEQDADKVMALWGMWGQAPQPALAGVLAKLGWPPGRLVEAKTVQDVLNAAAAGAAPEVSRAVVVLAQGLPVADEALNDAIHVAWVRSQSEALEQLITAQERQPGSPALEALHALVTGRLDRYATLRDEDGSLLAQAFAMAPPPFRERIARAVASSPDRRLKEAYRRALVGGGVDDAQSVASLKLVGDEDGLFEKTKSLRLGVVLDLCERWAGNDARPTHPEQCAVVDRAVTAYRSLGQFKVEPGPELPEGLVDIFEYWCREKPADADLRADLQADDPFRKTRGLYLGHERGLADRQRLATAAKSEHWPERLVARLVDPATLAEAREDHVLWVSVCAGDGALLQTPIGGTPEDYARHSDLLGRVRGAAASRTGALLEIVCAFQGAFVASGISIDETAEATEQTAVEIEDAGPVEF
ncbi:MAG: hypothetical protein MUC53_15080 [Candidatus Contendobacter sp.]|jgi:hypothetical protein|nr:hypothetical protein [Candidatus Contendobacter sp.]